MKTPLLQVTLLIVLASLSTIETASAQVPVPTSTLVDGIARSIDSSGSTIVVGRYDFGFGDEDRVSVFKRVNAVRYDEVATIESPSAQSMSGFGAALALDGDRLAVGSPLDGTSGCGRVYIHERNQGGPNAWGEVARIELPGLEVGDRFGESVALLGDRLVVGSPGDSPTGGIGTRGSVYVLERNANAPTEWDLVQTLAPPAGADARQFGRALSLDDTELAVAGLATTPLVAGRVDLFQLQGGSWNEVTSLSPPAAGYDFGFSIGLDEGRLAVGSPIEARLASATGKVQIYERDAGGAGAWGETACLRPSQGIDGDSFGWSLCLEGNRLWVGAPESFDDPGLVRTAPDPSPARLAGRVLSFSYDATGNWIEDYGVLGNSASFANPLGLGTMVGRTGKGFVAGERLANLSGRVQTFEPLGRPRARLAPNPENLGSARTGTAGTSAAGTFVFREKHAPVLHAGAGAYRVRPRMGSDLAATEDTLVVVATGVPQDPFSALVYERSGNSWAPTAKLIPSIPATSFRVDVDGDVAALGSANFNTAAIFERDALGTAWSEKASFANPLPGVFAWFGHAVAVAGDTVAVAAIRARVSGVSSAGSVYVYERDGSGGWPLWQTLDAPNPSTQLWFGEALALEGNVLAIASRPRSSLGERETHVFERSAPGDDWARTVTFSSAAGDLLDLDQGRLATLLSFGSEATLLNRTSGGSWVVAHKIPLPKLLTGQSYRRIRLHGDRLAVLQGTSSGNGVGRVLVYERNQGGSDAWGLLDEVVPSDWRPQDDLDDSFDFISDSIFLGASGASDVGEATGSLTVYTEAL